MKGTLAAAGLALSAAVGFAEAGDPPGSPSVQQEREAILRILDDYVRAFETADADLMESLFWLDDDRFVEVENHIREPFGRRQFLQIMDWIREHQEPGGTMHFYDTRVHLLTPDVATTVSMREMNVDGEVTTSRVTLIFLKKGGSWRIVQGHFSFAPE